MVEEKLAFINDVDDKSFINDECNKELHYFRCPKCGSYHVVRNGTYTRKTSLLNGDSAYIKVQKCLCRDCGISFKILPMCISGLNHLSLISLLKILLNTGSNNFLSKSFNVARSTVRNIKVKYKTLLSKIRLLSIKYKINTIQNLVESFYKEFSTFLFEPSTSLANYHFVINQLS